MSANNGQRARFHRQKKRRVVRLQKTRALAAELATKKTKTATTKTAS
jgi:hypothetical protein